MHVIVFSVAAAQLATSQLAELAAFAGSEFEKNVHHDGLVQSGFLPRKQAATDHNRSRTNPDIEGTEPDHLRPVFCSLWTVFKPIQTGFFAKTYKYPSFHQFLRNLMKTQAKCNVATMQNDESLSELELKSFWYKLHKQVFVPKWIWLYLSQFLTVFDEPKTQLKQLDQPQIWATATEKKTRPWSGSVWSTGFFRSYGPDL
ncbi:uncharacterized protein LACBIDRAFT_328279 [Laccaria bicolor S238N-H82]|uniref:Predicted protein n=1 Tax=Laccaria bicolor (strain S238N-H82 / ATCC MYA-4686) TaxID=486041 RepID=B0DEE1_LACBS|nr:uncharacterized protein LACBIDRAFT_328279 [Laccaria bicolor S238N-H82]EDR07021.1 predicted protein [Laccaria bicolor S238N-H82]|eukprot:XP_001882394.1 predicted protein [Laccaria bicolor S238N-H82]